MSVCVFCSGATKRKPSISCAVCKKQAHSTCVTDSVDLCQLLSNIKGLSWKCNECSENCISINHADISKLLEEKVESALSAVNDKIASIQSDISKTAKVNLPVIAEQPSYSDILKNNTQPAIVIQPKNVEQPISQTKSEITQNLNPSQSNIQLSRVKNLKNGGVLIGCKNRDDSEKFKKIIQDKMSQSYEIRELHGVLPRIRIVGMSEKYPEDQLVDYIKKCNVDLLHNSECKLIKLFSLRKNKDIFQCVLQLDRYSYDRVIKAGNLFIGFDSCAVFDAVEVYRCFKCNEFNHSSKFCKKPISCPLCGQNHDVKMCKSKVSHCTNCANLKNIHNTDVPTDHAVWEKEKCTAYIRARDKLRNDILSAQ